MIARRVFLICLLIVFGADAESVKNSTHKTSQKISTTQKKINASKQEIKIVDSSSNSIKQKLRDTQNNISNAKREIRLIDGKLSQISQNYVLSQTEYNQIAQEVAQYEQSLQEISNQLQVKHDKLVVLSAQQLSLSAAIVKLNESSQSSVLKEEYYKNLKIHNQQKIALLEVEIIKLKKLKEQRLVVADNAKHTLSYLKKQRVEYTTQKVNQQKNIEALNAQEDRYKKELDLVTKKQDELRATLAKLNILQQQEVEMAKQQAEEQRKAIALENERKKKLREQIAQAKDEEKKTGKKANIASIEQSSSKNDSIKQINSSYKAISTSNYSGGKTIPPISGAVVVKRFGTYEDPIYKMKIFNESITLQAPSSDTPVVSVLDGKVVYAGNSSMLGKVVVIAHAGNVHTVYAGLSKIPPTITAGTAVSRGYTIGKVDNKLIFETTKNSRQFNPLELIQM